MWEKQQFLFFVLLLLVCQLGECNKQKKSVQRGLKTKFAFISKYYGGPTQNEFISPEDFW